MLKQSRLLKYLQERNNIDEEFSGTDEDELSEKEEILLQNDTGLLDSESESAHTDDEEENIMNKHGGQKRMKLLSCSEEESEEKDQHISVDGTVWEEMPVDAVPRTPTLHNIFREVPGPTDYAKCNIVKGKVKTAFSLIIDNHIMKHIRLCTMEEANRIKKTEWSLSQAKLDAFIAILYARGAYESKNLKVSFLWNGTWGPKFFSETMSRNCFTEILRFIRFDRKCSRSQRLKTDKFALISAVWNKFIENSQNCYKPGARVTVEEQLFPTKARCRFTQYMPNKPEKFGIKSWLATDIDSRYIINALPYLGKDEDRPPSVPLGEYVVLKLMEPFMGCGRSVTTDTCFTSISLATKLLTKKTTLVGTILSNKKELPKIAKKKKDNMKRFSTRVFKSDNCTLTIYKSKPKKKVLLLSSKHRSVNIEKTDKSLPETVSYYNQSKFGVHTADQMARKYSTKLKSQRWPLQVFFNILDLAGINAWILYKETTGENISRQDFLLQLAIELAADYREARTKQVVTITEVTSINSPTDSNKRKTCQIRYCKENKTTKICSKCEKYVCGKCALEPLCVCKKCGAQ